MEPKGTRNAICGAAGCTDELRSAAVHTVNTRGRVSLAQAWIDLATRSPRVSLPALRGIEETTKALFKDIVNISLSASRQTAKDDSKSTITLYGMQDPHTTAILNEITVSPNTSVDGLRQVVAQTLLVTAFTDPESHHAVKHLSWVPPATAQRYGTSRPASDNKRAIATTSTRYLMARRAMTTLTGPQSIPVGHAEVIQTAPVPPLPTSYLPARAWPEVVNHHPEVGRRAHGLLPLTSTITLAALGHPTKPKSQRRHFGIVVKEYLLEIELQALWASGDSARTLGYYLTLHDHLRVHPPPIDYQRRRAVFPSPIILYDKGTRHPHPTRFVWQLLTGSDPFGNSGARSFFGPFVKSYISFVANLTSRQGDTLVNEAKRLLALNGFGGEPVVYTPIFEAGQFRRPSPTELEQRTLDSVILPGSYVLELLDPNRGITAETLIRQALDGDVALARAIYRFARTANQHQTRTAEAIGFVQKQISLDEGLLEGFLGRNLHVRGRRGNPRYLTRTGVEMYEAASAQLARLAAIAEIEERNPPRPAADIDKNLDDRSRALGSEPPDD
ncbi:hypothetical protein [Nocardia sp. 348MFTsu5.1]|uniref:hypothetical protein n=1 Tax=Nocardia sp. 348MFTsu5.1 TaxID=1172185 RepID=UPI001E38C328|nr:hypothetical protein [Nocardia sp. 348MFTsu5.1]